MLSLPEPRHVPCTRCGASVERDLLDDHRCEEKRRLEYELFQLRPGLERFEGDLAAWLETPWGRFETFYASYRRHKDR
jgi:hypothetical protein